MESGRGLNDEVLGCCLLELVHTKDFGFVGLEIYRWNGLVLKIRCFGFGVLELGM